MKREGVNLYYYQPREGGSNCYSSRCERLAGTRTCAMADRKASTSKGVCGARPERCSVTASAVNPVRVHGVFVSDVMTRHGGRGDVMT
eukprot:3473586-Rhodomonas_salina.4